MKVDLVTSQTLRKSERFQSICETLARLHIAGAPNDLISQIGIDFLKNLFYPGLIISPRAVVLTIMDGETIAAFVAAVLDMKQCLRQIVMSHPLRSVWYGFSCILLRPKLWGAFLESMRLHAPEQAQSTAEILMITTATNYRGRGFGVKLLSMLDDDLGRRGMQACLARVREDNAHALAMYKTIGYHEIGSVTFNGSQWRWLVRELPKKQVIR